MSISDEEQVAAASQAESHAPLWRLGSGSITLILAVVAGCTSVRPPEPSQWNDPRLVFRVALNSSPDGAAVFGMSGAVAGSRIGQTPIVIEYTGTGLRNRAIWCRNCAGVGARQTLLVQRHSSLLAESCVATFRAVVVLEGYEPYTLRQVIHREHGVQPFTSPKDCFDDLEGTRVEFTAVLERSASAGQQQQQQQQTIVIPGAENNQRGTVFVTSNVESAEVYVGGLFVGNVPATLRLQDALHSIEVRSAGYVTYRRDVRVLAGSELSLRAELTRQ